MFIGNTSHSIPFKKVQTETDMQEFLQECMGFHDGVIKELHMLNAAYVSDDYSISCNFRYDMHMLVQTQWEEAPAVEILFGDISEFHLSRDSNTMDIIYGSNGEVSVNPVSGSISITFELDSNRFICGALAYRIRRDYMGVESRFGEEIVLDPSQDVERIDDEWAICRKCNETWKHEGRVMLVCPICRDAVEDI